MPTLNLGEEEMHQNIWGLCVIHVYRYIFIKFRLFEDFIRLVSMIIAEWDFQGFFLDQDWFGDLGQKWFRKISKLRLFFSAQIFWYIFRCTIIVQKLLYRIKGTGYSQSLIDCFILCIYSLITLVVQLIMKIDFTTLEVLEFLLGIASPGNNIRFDALNLIFGYVYYI